MPQRIPDDIVPKGKAIYEGLRAQLEQADWGSSPSSMSIRATMKWTQGRGSDRQAVEQTP